MPFNRLHPELSGLLVIDMQDKFPPLIRRWELILGRCIRLIHFYRLMRSPILATEQYPKGLGHTVPKVKDALSLTDAILMEKTCFSSAGSPQLREQILALGKRQWVICGIETHVCVQQTAFDLLQLGLEVFLPTDAASSRNETDHDVAVQRMRRADVNISTSESLIFEALQDSTNPAFKQAINLVK
jgi:isochorismate hydrolase